MIKNKTAGKTDNQDDRQKCGNHEDRRQRHGQGDGKRREKLQRRHPRQRLRPPSRPQRRRRKTAKVSAKSRPESGTDGESHRKGDSTSYTPVSAEVEAHTPLIQKYAKQYGIPGICGAYQGGDDAGIWRRASNDPIQAAEGASTRDTPMSQTASKPPEYYIECGVQELKAALISAEVENPIDMERIKLALQGYNRQQVYLMGQRPTTAAAIPMQMQWSFPQCR